MGEALQNHSPCFAENWGTVVSLPRLGRGEYREEEAEFGGTEGRNVRVVPPGYLGFPHTGVSREVWAPAFNLLRREVDPWGLDVRRSWAILKEWFQERGRGTRNA